MKNYQKDFTVVILCYNPDLLKLKRTFKSIYSQKDVTFQIVISDDGSSVDYLKPFKQWLDYNKYDNVKFNVSSVNKGTIENIRGSLSFCDSKYIKLISPGDCLFDSFVLLNVKKEMEIREIDILYTDFCYYLPELKILENKSPLNPLTKNERYMKKYMGIFHDYICGAAIFGTRESFDLLYDLPKTIRLCEDLCFDIYSFVRNKKVGFYSKKCIWYEYGMGVSTLEKRNPIMEDDHRFFFLFLKENYSNNKFASKSYKFYEINNISNRFVRLLLKLIHYPSYCFFILHKAFKDKTDNKELQPYLIEYFGELDK